MKSTYLELINEGLSIRKIAEKLNISFSSAKYWINKYELKTNYNPHNKSTTDANTKKCPKCSLILDKKHFYTTKNAIQGYCKSCSNILAVEKGIERKIWAIGYKGGKCIDCHTQYPNKPYVIFDFHHLNPDEKEMQWEKIRLASEKRMIEELDKCVLLCSNCHRIREHEIQKGM